MRGRGRWVILVGTVVLAVAYLMSSAFSAGFVYYLTVEELLARAPEVTGRFARVAGFVAPGSVDWQPSGLSLRFTLQAREQGGPAVPVVYRGPRPDLLADRVEVIVEGRLDPSGVLVARQLLVKCPSKYEAAEAPR